jgi:hypothetical protein
MLALKDEASESKYESLQSFRPSQRKHEKENNKWFSLRF